MVNARLRGHRSRTSPGVTGPVSGPSLPPGQTSQSNLVPVANPNQFDQTYLAFWNDWHLADPAPAPAPFPLQVIPRMAFTINYNYVYDEDQQEWVPQTPFSGGGGGAFELIDSGTFDVPDSSGAPNFPFDPGVSTFQEGAFGTLGLADESDLVAGQINFMLSDETAESTDTIAWKFGYDPAVPGYFFDINHEIGNTITVRWAIVKPNF